MMSMSDDIRSMLQNSMRPSMLISHTVSNSLPDLREGMLLVTREGHPAGAGHACRVSNIDWNPPSFSVNYKDLFMMRAHDRFLLSDFDRFFVPHENKEKPKKISTHYKPGMAIDTYVDKLLKLSIDQEQLKWLKTFKNCVLPQHVKDTVEEALTVVLNNKKFDEWGINKHFEKGITNSILLYGPPGTGKTMIAETFAAILDKNLMKIDSGLLQSNIPGQTERNIKNAFTEAKKKDCVLMFDECDSVLSNRDMVGVVLSAEINTLLTELERFDGVCVLTTNRLHRLDPALARRIIAKIELGLPDKTTRVEIWKKLLPPEMPLDKNIDFEQLATAILSGGEIKNSILLAARKAIAKNENCVSMMHFNAAVNLTVESKKEFESKQPVYHAGFDITTHNNLGNKKDAETPSWVQDELLTMKNEGKINGNHHTEQ